MILHPSDSARPRMDDHNRHVTTAQCFTLEQYPSRSADVAPVASDQAHRSADLQSALRGRKPGESADACQHRRPAPEPLSRWQVSLSRLSGLVGALGWLGGRNRLAINTLCSGSDVACRSSSLEVGCTTPCTSAGPAFTPRPRSPTMRDLHASGPCWLDVG